MHSATDLFYIIIGTAIITAALVASLAGTAKRPQEPQIIYVQTIPVPQQGGNGCMPFIILGVIVLALVLASH